MTLMTKHVLRTAAFGLTLLLLTSCEKKIETLSGTKSAVNETAAIGALRVIASAQVTYSATHEGEYGTFQQLVDGGNLDARFGSDSPVIQGYVLNMRVSSKDSSGRSSYSVNADPERSAGAAQTGNRHFFLDGNDNTIHVSSSGTASSSDPQL